MVSTSKQQYNLLKCKLSQNIAIVYNAFYHDHFNNNVTLMDCMEYLIDHMKYLIDQCTVMHQYIYQYMMRNLLYHYTHKHHVL